MMDYAAQLDGFPKEYGRPPAVLHILATLETLTPLNKESGPFSRATIAFGVFPLFLLGGEKKQ